MCKSGKMCEVCLAKKHKGAHVKLAAKVEAALKNLSAAEDAIRAGKKDVALAKLAKTRGVLKGLRDSFRPGPVAVKTVNAVCPMMGGKFNPNKVASKLVREHNGRKVGFCCAGCPEKWDKLSAAKKGQKLAAALTKK